MQFGITYYPDLYPKETWDKEFEKIKNTGFEVVRFNEMSWSFVQPKEDVLDFSELDHALALCEKHKLKVVLGVPVAQAPQWLIKKHPEILPVANDGYIHPETGPRPNACRDNLIYQKYAENLTKAMAEKYAKHSTVLMWQIDNEPHYPPLDLTTSRDFCHCKATKQAFVEWAKEKYKTIEKLNEAWGTKFWSGTLSEFDEITTPKCGMWDAGNPSIYLDWFRFKSDSLSGWLKRLKQIIRAYDKEHKIGTNGFTTIISRSVDHRVIAQGMDWFGWDIYPKGTQNNAESLSQIADYWRSVCDAVGAEFVVAELQAGPNVRWGHPGEVSGKDIKEWVKILTEHGAKLILFHNWRPPLFGSETGGFGLTNPDGSDTERSEAVRKLIREHKEPPRRCVGAGSGIAIYYSRSSDIETYQEEDPSKGLFYGNNAIAGAYKLCYKEGIRPDFIFEQDLEKTVPSCKVLLLTNPYLLSKNQFDHLKQFVERGGVLISESRFGLKDENAHLYEKPLIIKMKRGKGLMIYAANSFSRLPLRKILKKVI